ncbi:50S ribosomal protein L25 [Alicyclobacillus sp. SO9]|uniref:50S ribosomal protein L25 n=1 Tax=Alicyclobacillus sp. SO9 TaxID=2665646 RepID=UPI0018E7019B|nr:50S ribosomal protein L25 [Alicyclobacillus sp. SO9]QQE79406.1 50S ribosomal protein L25 [Alicyclobacillus sp. SO9]
MNHPVLEAEVRDTHGSTLARLRKGGRVPAVVYGNGMPATAISVLDKAFIGENPLRSGLVQLALDGKKVNAMIHQIQRHPVSLDILHIDFYQVNLNEPIDSKIPVHVHGVEEVERRRGIVQQQLREVEVHALPEKTPEYLSVDVSNLENGDHLSLGDIELPAGVELRSDAAEVVVSVLVSKRTAETEEDSSEAAEVEE